MITETELSMLPWIFIGNECPSRFPNRSFNQTLSHEKLSIVLKLISLVDKQVKVVTGAQILKINFQDIFKKHFVHLTFE